MNSNPTSADADARVPLYRRKAVVGALVLVAALAAWLATSDLRLAGGGVRASDVSGRWRFDEAAYATLSANLLGKAAGNGSPLTAYGEQLAGTSFDFAPDAYTVTRASSSRTIACTYQTIAEDTLQVQPAGTAVNGSSGTPAKSQDRAIPPGFGGGKQALDPSGRLTLVVDAAHDRLMLRTAVFAFPFTRAP